MRLGAYADPLRQWILACKFAGWSEMGFELGRRLGAAVAAARVVDRDRAVIVPMPMPWLRRVYRGIDHARVIASGAAAALGVPAANILRRTGAPPQITLSATERRRAVARTLAVRRRIGGWPLEGCHLLVIDDVRTTGGSLRSAVGQLRRLRPARIVSAAIAVADDPARPRPRSPHTSTSSLCRRQPMRAT